MLRSIISSVLLLLTVMLMQVSSNLLLYKKNEETADYQVIIMDETFIPEKIVILEGDTIIWVNKSTRRHTVTAWYWFYDEDFTVHVMIGKEWDSGYIEPGDVYTRVFDRAGSFDYMSLPLLESPGFPMTPYLFPDIDKGRIIVNYRNSK